MLKSRNMLIFGYIWDFRGWWRHQMTPKFQKRWNLPKIVKTNLKTFEKMYNTANLNDFWFSWLWRHNDVTITSRSRFPIGLLVFFEIECRKEQCVKVSFQYPQVAVCFQLQTQLIESIDIEHSNIEQYRYVNPNKGEEPNLFICYYRLS